MRMMKRLSLRSGQTQQQQLQQQQQQSQAPGGGPDATTEGYSNAGSEALASALACDSAAVNTKNSSNPPRRRLMGLGRGRKSAFSSTSRESNSDRAWRLTSRESFSSIASCWSESSALSLHPADMPPDEEQDESLLQFCSRGVDDEDDAATRTTAAESSSCSTSTTTTTTTPSSPSSSSSTELTLKRHHYSHNLHCHRRRRCRQLDDWAPAPSLLGAAEQWVIATQQVLRSDDVRVWLAASQRVLGTASSVAVRAALFLPVTLPLAVAQHVAGGCCHAAVGAASLVLQLVVPHHRQQSQHPRLLTDASSTAETATETNNDADAAPGRAPKVAGDSAEGAEDEKRDNGDDAHFGDDETDDSNLVAHVLGVPWMLIHAANKVKDDLGSLVVQAVAPPPSSQPTSRPQPSPATPPDPDDFAIRKGKLFTDRDDYYCEQDRFLDRLRLDYSVETPLVECYSHATSADVVADQHCTAKICDSSSLAAATRPVRGPDPSLYSKFLLPVHDLGLLTENGQPISFVDLQLPESNKSNLDPVVCQALHRLVEVGVAWLANHPTVRLTRLVPPPKLAIDWKPESHTPKLLKKMAPLSSLDRLHLLEREVLVWSGSLGGAKFPFFLARGVVARSPLEFMRMLWDNNRTAEYNNFCLGRTSQLVLQDQILSDPPSKATTTGTKVVQSETRVPFTSLSVLVSCVMHVRPLEAPDEGFVIISRSVHTGRAGTHCSDSSRDVEPSSKNEILWGMNVLRRVPNHPCLTDLTSLSQVGSTLVPKFLATRIGLMGIEDFFKNVRTAKTSPPPSSTTN